MPVLENEAPLKERVQKAVNAARRKFCSPQESEDPCPKKVP